MSLRTLMSLSLALAVGVGSGLTLYLSHRQAELGRTDETRAVLERAAPILADQLDRTLRDVGRDVSLGALDGRVARPDRAADLDAYLVAWRRLRPEYTDILVADRAGRVRATASGKLIGSDVSGAVWFARGLQGVAAADASERNRAGTEAPRNVIVSAPVPDGGGVVAIQMTPRWIEEATQLARRSLGAPGEGISFSVLNASGRLVLQVGAVKPDHPETQRLEVSAPLDGSERPGLGWLLVARATPGTMSAAGSGVQIPHAIVLALLAVGIAGWLGGSLVSRRIRNLEAACRQEAAGLTVTALPIRELQSLADAAAHAIARGKGRERMMQDARAALVRSRERVRAFKTMAGWSCWEVDLTNGRVTWTDAVLPILPSTSELATTLDDLVDRLDPEDRDLMRVAMRAAIAAGGSAQDVTLRTLPVAGEQSGRRLHLRMAKVLDDGDARERLHVLSREVGVASLPGSPVTPIAKPLAPAANEPLLERRRDGLLRQVTDGIVHDVNNALAVVMTALGSLQRHGHDLPDRALQLVDVAQRGARNGASLTRRVSALTRREVSTLAEVDIALVLDDLTDFLRSSVAPEITIGLSLDEALPPVLCSERQIEILILNLVLDIKAVAPAGCGVSLVVQAAEPPTTSLLASRPSLRLTLSAPVNLANRRGLASVADLADEIGAAVDVQASEASTTVSVWLPAGERQAVVEAAADGAAENLAVLLVEADALLRSTTASALSDLGHTVTQAASSAQAVEILAGRRDFDLLLVDYALPGMSGLQLAATVSRTHPRIRTILAGPRGHLPANAQVFQQLHKPFGLPELVRALQSRGPERREQEAA
ncbi:response regulator [Methylobacterium durans]|uniref:response regulator n=1 Tax=Methylobacterium durans TaxID=2202825 RepID=UPI001F02B0C5|nr:response regulator [Methylobacterium durans]